MGRRCFILHQLTTDRAKTMKLASLNTQGSVWENQVPQGRGSEQRNEDCDGDAQRPA